MKKGHKLCVVPDRKKNFITFCPERRAELICRMELFIGTMRQKQVGVILNMGKYLQSDLESSDQSCKIQVLFVLGHAEFHRIRVYASIILSEGSGSFTCEGCALWQKLFLDPCMCVYLYKHP